MGGGEKGDASMSGGRGDASMSGGGRREMLA